VVIRPVCGLAGLTYFDSPGFGIAFSIARETDQASLQLKHRITIILVRGGDGFTTRSA
jgi:hypothetical protein